MTPMKVDVLIAAFSYGGNGGVHTLIEQREPWFARVYHQMMGDERIGRVARQRFGDIPLTMERNRAVAMAKDKGFDIIWMLDSDNDIDMYVGADPDAKPFWESSFDFAYDRLTQNLPSVVMAPYCGPPPHPVRGGVENVYAFQWASLESDVRDPSFKMEAYSREHANLMRGIQPCAAGPTGCSLYTTSALDLMPIRKETQEELMDMFQRGEISKENCLRRMNMSSWFFYEYTDCRQTEKASTEDVTNTREISMAGHAHLQQDVVFMNWDAWAGHGKPKIVGKPMPMRADMVSGQFREGIESGLDTGDRVVEVDFTPTLNRMQQATPGPQPSGNGSHKSEKPVSDPAVEIRARRLPCGRMVRSVGHVTPDAHLESLTNFTEVLSKQLDHPLRVIEVGSWVGESALSIHAGFQKEGGTVFCVDHFRGNAFDHLGEIAKKLGPTKLHEYFKENVGDLYGEGIKLICEKSEKAARHLDPQEADMIFIDAGHEYEDVLHDCRFWWKHLADYGWMLGHDFCDAFPGVSQAVKELFEDRGCTVRLYEGTSIWAVSKQEYLAANPPEEVSSNEG